MAADRGTFGRLGFVLAAVGSAVGLGNIWKFPYITYANDGGSFVLIYLVAIVLIGAPIMVAEILIGRHTQKSPVSAFLSLASEIRVSKSWSLVGALGVLTGFVLLSYYSVIAGWTVYYFGRCLAWSFRGYDVPEGQLGAQFGEFLGNAPAQIGFQALFVALTVGVVYAGVKSGIERFAKIVMPVLGFLLIALALNSIRSPGFGEAIRFLFHIGPIDADGVLEAVGHSFFTLSLGMGAMITYGSYIGKKESIPRSTVAVCLLDTLVALLACVIMFSVIFTVPEELRGETFSQSATILFTTLPQMFYELPLGALLSPLFYILVAFAALTSTISLLEVLVSYWIDQRGWQRHRATLLCGVAVFLLGIPAALSLGASSKLSSVEIPFLPEGTAGVFSIFDYTVSNWFLPVGGMLIAIFVGWFAGERIPRKEIEQGHGPVAWFGAWRFFLRFVAPLAIGWIIFAVLQGRSFA